VERAGRRRGQEDEGLKNRNWLKFFKFLGASAYFPIW